MGGDAMLWWKEIKQGMQLSEHVKLFQERTNSCLKHEDGGPFQENLHSVIGNEVIEAFDERLTDIGLIRHEHNEEHWSFWLGIDLGSNETTWNMERSDTGNFDPDVTNVDMPKLNQSDSKYAEKLNLPAQEGDSTIVGDDECSARWDKQLSEHMKLFQEGTNFCLKRKESEPFQDKLHSVIVNETNEAFD